MLPMLKPLKAVQLEVKVPYVDVSRFKKFLNQERSTENAWAEIDNDQPRINLTVTRERVE